MVQWRPIRPPRTKIQKKDVLFIIGKWKAKVGSQEIPGVPDNFGRGVQNEAGQRLTVFCQENTLVMAKVHFQQHKRWLYMWTSPDGQYFIRLITFFATEDWQLTVNGVRFGVGLLKKINCRIRDQAWLLRAFVEQKFYDLDKGQRKLLT